MARSSGVACCGAADKLVKARRKIGLLQAAVDEAKAAKARAGAGSAGGASARGSGGVKHHVTAEDDLRSAVEAAQRKAARARDVAEAQAHARKRAEASLAASRNRITLLEERNAVLEARVSKLLASSAQAAEEARFERDILRMEVERERQRKAPSPAEALLLMYERQAHWLGKYKEMKNYARDLEAELDRVYAARAGAGPRVDTTTARPSTMDDDEADKAAEAATSAAAAEAGIAVEAPAVEDPEAAAYARAQAKLFERLIMFIVLATAWSHKVNGLAPEGPMIIMSVIWLGSSAVALIVEALDLMASTSSTLIPFAHSKLLAARRHVRSLLSLDQGQPPAEVYFVPVLMIISALLTVFTVSVVLTLSWMFVDIIIVILKGLVLELGLKPGMFDSVIAFLRFLRVVWTIVMALFSLHGAYAMTAQCKLDQKRMAQTGVLPAEVEIVPWKHRVTTSPLAAAIMPSVTMLSAAVSTTILSVVVILSGLTAALFWVFTSWFSDWSVHWLIATIISYSITRGIKRAEYQFVFTGDGEIKRPVASDLLYYANLVVYLGIGAPLSLLHFVVFVFLHIIQYYRPDKSSQPRGLELTPVDVGFCSYVGMLLADRQVNNPVLRVAVDIFSSPRDGPASSPARNRWFLALTLINNPALARYRRSAPRADSVADNESSSVASNSSTFTTSDGDGDDDNDNIFLDSDSFDPEAPLIHL
ncbi:uncharacterized protein AMSG_12422 [Thecamonas trahens ATCC 50062]|uniref:Transmembrane protein n=1 Tax=Thecamonas trahens ATCC 50062 TaxID=461836 RepID=A0A0L0DUI5_THETB|nr:hypothetical protein AMSG_12422 [Thecamonas trahens ATCC 50062]KNC55716.1 hypothetical protein AMSG_12422 [Thecamonas trahens ATCC 50062]|eukprot:XP_013752938.1 hypothetical protein AMSG_12422 [Thecamonas trahens ATCC 50062]